MTQSPAKTSSIILLSFWLLTFLGVLYQGNQSRQAAQVARSIVTPKLGDQDANRAKGLSAESQLLLYGDPSQENEEARWKALYDSDPDNPHFYLIYLQHADELPDDFHETVARIDPGNGWYSLWEVSQLEPASKKSSEILQKSKREEFIKKGLPLSPRTYEITDLETFHHHLAILEKGLLASRVEHYSSEIATRRFEALPPPFDYISNINSIAVAASTSIPALAWKDGTEILCAALQLAESEVEFHRLENLCLKLEEHLYQNSTTLVSGLIYKVVIHVQSSSLRAAAERLNLPEAETFYRDRQLRFQKESERQNQRNMSYDLDKLLEKRADTLTNLTMPTVHKILPDPPELTAEMLKPALRAERAVASRIFYFVFFILLSLGSLIVWLRGRNRENPASFQPDTRTLLLGSLLPFVLLLIFRYFLSFGMLDFGGRLLSFWNYLIPEIAILLVLLVIPVILTNQKAEPERSFLGTWWPLGLALLGLLFASAMMHLLSLGAIVFLVPGLFLCVTIVWIMGHLVQPGFDRDGRIAPCYLLSAALCSLFIFALVAEERSWFKKEGIHRASATSLSVYETKTAQLLNEFIHDLRGPDRQ